jgi:hypothetical protein
LAEDGSKVTAKQKLYKLDKSDGPDPASVKKSESSQQTKADDSARKGEEHSEPEQNEKSQDKQQKESKGKIRCH